MLFLFFSLPSHIDAHFRGKTSINMCVIELFVFYKTCSHMLPNFVVRSQCEVAKQAGQRICETLHRRVYPYGLILRQVDGLCDMCHENNCTGPWDREEHLPTILYYTRAIDHLQRVILFLYHLGLWPTHTDGPMCPSLSKLTQRHLWTKAGLDNLYNEIMDVDPDLINRYTMQELDPIDMEVFPEFNRFMQAHDGYTELGEYPQDLVAPLPSPSRRGPLGLHGGGGAMTAMDSTWQDVQSQPQQHQEPQQSQRTIHNQRVPSDHHIIHRTPSAQNEHDEALRQIIRSYEPHQRFANHESPDPSTEPSSGVDSANPPPAVLDPTQSYIPDYALVLNELGPTNSHSLPYPGASNSMPGTSFQVLQDLSTFINDPTPDPQEPERESEPESERQPQREIDHTPSPSSQLLDDLEAHITEYTHALDRQQERLRDILRSPTLMDHPRNLPEEWLSASGMLARASNDREEEEAREAMRRAHTMMMMEEGDGFGDQF